MTNTPELNERHGGDLKTLALGALGVVYGDIGTSPLYTIKTAIDWAGGAMAPEEALGMLSLIVWTLLIITSIKYVAVIMRADNDGEGGILALMSLLGVKHGRNPAIIAIGMLGAALLFGDGAITPAISVLSALEGLKTPAPAIAPYVVPLSVAVLVGLFSVQSQGTGQNLQHFRPDHDAMVHRHRRAWPRERRAASGRALGARSARRTDISFRSRRRRLPRAWRGLPLRHRRRSPLRRHGAFWSRGRYV